MKKIFYSFFLVFLLFQYPLISAEKSRNYKSFISFINNLDNNFSVQELEKVIYKNEQYPIYKISYNPLNETKGKKYLIISGVHGNEPAPFYAIKDFLLSLNKKEVKRKDLQIDFILVTNPYGFEYNQRYNGKNLDINRDMTKLETQEATILTKYCNPKDYNKVFDFHEANASGFFLYCYGTKNNKLSDKFLSLLKNENVVFDNEYKDKILTVKNGKLYVPAYASSYMKLNKTVTSGIYYKNCKNSFTFETSKNEKIEERKRIITILLNYIINEC